MLPAFSNEYVDDAEMPQTEPVEPPVEYIYLSAQVASESGSPQTIYLGGVSAGRGQTKLGWSRLPKQWLFTSYGDAGSLELRDSRQFLTGDGLSSEPQPIQLQSADVGTFIVDPRSQYALNQMLQFGPLGNDVQTFDLELCEENCDARFNEERFANLQHDLRRLEGNMGECCSKKNRKPCVIL
jgi:hypothetical protein